MTNVCAAITRSGTRCTVSVGGGLELCHLHDPARAPARKRAAAEAGLPAAVTAREADDLLRDAERFLAVVETALGLPHQPLLASG